MDADAALGPPGKMAERSDDLTPMMSQYFRLCRQYDDSLVLFQVGDFYEAFCEAAERVARICEITLTKREDSTGEYAMAGIPIDNAESYVDRLLDAGYRVAIADQVQDPEETTGVVDRAVTRIITPGTLTEDELLRSPDNNFVACLTAGDGYALALLDVSTGDFYATGADSLDPITDELGRFAPAEAIVAPEAPVEAFDGDCMVTPYDRTAFDLARARERVAEYFGSPETLLASDEEIRACGALLSYAEYTRGGTDREGDGDGDGADHAAADGEATTGGRLDYLNHLTRYDPREYMLLDAVAVESLELFEPRAVRGHEEATLLGVLDETSCALGNRTLTDWLRRPLIDPAGIETRLDAVEAFTERVRVRETVAARLREVYDIERLIARVSRGRADARDLRSLHATLAAVPEIRAAMEGVESESLSDLRADLDGFPSIRDLIDRAIVADPPAEITEGGIIARGYSDDLDELRETERRGKDWIDDLEAAERERTGIDSLKVGFTSVHGYYIEVTNPNLDRVPEDYQRRQTLKNAERFYTPELKEREDEIIRAEQRADDLEYELFRELRETVAAESERIQALADTLARLDALAALAESAAKHDYVRPEVGADEIEVRGGRHPVVERTRESFVPNDAHLTDERFLAVVTGPNMSGKSTYMRQVALVAIMAQVGSFVPADSARLPILDRVFTRVGASDDIAGGRSTFMVEMTELADILAGATADSLVLLDEVGRGTSTTDGLAIARAITEHVHDELGAWTLFATHHHELTETARTLDGAVNLHFDASREGGDVVFDHEVGRGPATASYGVEVASMAGVPDAVVERSRELLDGEGATDGRAADDATAPDPGASGAGDEGTIRRNGHGDPALDGEEESAGDRRGTNGSDGIPGDVAAELREVDVARTTPLEALETLARLKRLVEERE